MKKTTICGRMLMVMALLVSFGCAKKGEDGAEKQSEQKVKMAAIFPGSIQDADYNMLGYMALQDATESQGLKSAYSEKVAVSDAERVIKEYVNADYNILLVHGAQFNGVVGKLAADYPDTTFIIEVDGKPENPAPNVWYIERNYYIGFYVLGALAVERTETGKIGFIGGLNLPFIRGEINAVKQAIKDMKSDASLEYIFVGDFNDPLKTRQAAEGLISQGVDVIISAVNLGNFGLYNAVKEASKPVYITTTYTGKEEQAPDNYMTSDLFDFSIPVQAIVGKIIAGETTGFWPMEYGEGKERSTEFPIKNSSDAVNSRIREIAADVASGKIKVNAEMTEIQE